MINLDTNQDQTLITLVSGACLAVAALLAVVAFSSGPMAQADSHTPCGEDVCQNESASFTISAVAQSPSIDTFEAQDPNIDFGANPPQIDVDDLPFELVWNTSNTDTLTASGDWSGAKSLPSGSESLTPAPGTYTYDLEATSPAGETASESVTVEVIDPPSFTFSVDLENVDLSGAPGSTASVPMSITTNNFSGDVNLSLDDIPDSLENDDGNLVDFTFEDSTLNSSNPSTQLNMEVVQPIPSDISPTIQINAVDPSGVTENSDQNDNFTINAEGFSPRTIEEF